MVFLAHTVTLDDFPGVTTTNVSGISMPDGQLGSSEGWNKAGIFLLKPSVFARHITFTDCFSGIITSFLVVFKSQRIPFFDVWTN